MLSVGTRARTTALLALAIAVLLAGCGGDDAEEAGEELSGSAQEAVVQDAEAMAAARTAQTALEAQYVDSQSYAGATPQTLAELDPTLPVDRLTVQGTAQTYDLTVASESGNTFTVSKDESGSTDTSCQTAGEGGCPEGGAW